MRSLSKPAQWVIILRVCTSGHRHLTDGGSPFPVHLFGTGEFRAHDPMQLLVRDERSSTHQLANLLHTPDPPPVDITLNAVLFSQSRASLRHTTQTLTVLLALTLSFASFKTSLRLSHHHLLALVVLSEYLRGLGRSSWISTRNDFDDFPRTLQRMCVLSIVVTLGVPDVGDE